MTRLAAAAALAAVVALSGCASANAGSTTSVMPTPAASVAAATPTPKPTVRTPAGPAPLPKTASVTVASVTIKAIDVHATGLEKLRVLGDGTLAAPKDPDRAGWFSGGTVPGEVGPAVIAGHIDSLTGPAVFFELRELKQGDKVTVGLSNGKKTTFTVDDVITTAKKGFPTERVFGPTPDAQLRLITCGGPYNRSAGGYEDNTVVFATAL